MMMRLIAKSITVALFGAFASASSFADTKMQFALDWKFEGPSAPYFLAIDNGHFAAAGMEVEISPGKGSLDAIPKVATGAFPVGFADINSLIKFLDQNPGAPVTAVMMVYDKPPFAVVGRKSLGISGPSDLEGSVLGALPPDGAWAQFPSFAKANNLDMDKIKVEPVGFPTREPMLAEGKVDWSFTSEIEEIMVETRTPYWIPHSVTAYCAVYRGDLYLLSAYYEGGDFPQARSWNKNVIRDPRIRLKIQSDIYKRELRFLGGGASKELIHDAFLKKYKNWQSPSLENVHIFLVEDES